MGREARAPPPRILKEGKKKGKEKRKEKAGIGEKEKRWEKAKIV